MTRQVFHGSTFAGRLWFGFIAMMLVSASAMAIVVDDLGNVNRNDLSFWDVASHAGVTVDEGASSPIGSFDSGGRISDGDSSGTDIEARWYSSDSSAAIPFDSTKPCFVLFVR